MQTFEDVAALSGSEEGAAQHIRHDPDRKATLVGPYKVDFTLRGFLYR